MACTTCNGEGTLPATDPRVDAQVTDELGICPDCWHKGICPDCGQLGWEAPNDNNLSSAPCSYCGWNHKVTGEFEGERPLTKASSFIFVALVKSDPSGPFADELRSLLNRMRDAGL